MSVLPKPLASKAAVALVLCAVLGAAWRWHDLAPMLPWGVRSVPDAAPSTGQVAHSEVAHPPTFTTGLERLPSSLIGTDPPAGLIINEAGHLVVRRSLRDFFDYFLSALGEEPLPTLNARIKAYMAKSLPGPALAEAIRILDGYVGYRLALQSLSKAGGKPIEQLDLASVVAQKQQERSLRAKYLAEPVAAVFFGDDDRYDDYTLSRLQVEGDSSLSPAEQNKRLDALFAQLPPGMQAQIRSLQSLQDLEQVEARCQQQGCTAGQLYQQRSALLGDEVAVRLQALDGVRAEWSVRVETYLAHRASILSDPSLSDTQRQAQLLGLRQRSFTSEEQLRLNAFEHGQAHATGL